MPYCIQCGVKLNDRYDSCPLCNLELEFPNPKKKLPPLYPSSMHKISIIKSYTNTKERIAIHFIGFLTALITLLTTGIDFYINESFSWSRIVTISVIFVYLSFSTFFNLKRNPKLLYTAENFFIGVYLYGLDLLTTNNSWFISYALPCFISLQLISLILSLLIRKIKQKIIQAVIILLVTNIFLIIINEITVSEIPWSHITTSILFPTSIYLIYLNYRFRNLDDAPQAIDP